MKTLTNYTKNKHDFSLLARSEDIAMFRGLSQNGQSHTFEVIEIQSHDGREIGGKWCDAAEYPPSNEQWGSKGFTVTTLDRAVEKMREMLARPKKGGDS